MSRNDLLRQLAAALSAAGLLGAPAAAQAEPPEPPASAPPPLVVRQPIYGIAAAPVPTPRPAHQALYAVAWREARKQRSQELRKLEEAADALLRYADTEAGQADLKQDLKLAQLIEELRVIKSEVQRERDRAQEERRRAREEWGAPQPLYAVAE